MADTAKRLSGPTQLTASAVTQYTAPAVAVIRSIHCANTSGAQQGFTVSIGTDAAGTRLFHAQPVPASDSFDWSGNIVLAAGETIQALASGASALTLTISGIETTGAPGAWQEWSPTMTGSTSNPLFGTGQVRDGFYIQNGTTVFATGSILFGTGATDGSGRYQFSLPVDALMNPTGPRVCGSGYLIDSSSNALWTLVASVPNGTGAVSYVEMFYTGTGGAFAVSHDSPWSITHDADQVNISVVYEAA